MGEDWIDFEKFRWSLVCSYMINVVEMHKIADSFKPIRSSVQRGYINKWVLINIYLYFYRIFYIAERKTKNKFETSEIAYYFFK